MNRKKGTANRKHCHQGIIKSKSPELLYSVKGKVKIVVKEIDSEIFEEYNITIVETNYFTYTSVAELEYHEKCTDNCKALHALNEFSSYGIVFIVFLFLIKVFGVWCEKPITPPAPIANVNKK